MKRKKSFDIEVQWLVGDGTPTKGEGKIIGNNPNLETLNKGDLIHEIDFRSVYATLLKQKFNFDAQSININQSAIAGLF
jgi:uncharacterized protein (DUF1501 family)